ncbi:META domain-containing protein [Cyanobium sp. N.Huapi 1H5]|uniref:META domain-containing protein n=1 Tax=Cyanobium sp. N.Huapi 1H5 TaxID=2823719 RepID=UPI0020CF3622|nr:META domain-containing protein [Cyanobium sp. N.Huapi 1H5]MCP9837052.1 META domain-containing protein [Cyanobium sp. N.Huapi 1H5]
MTSTNSTANTVRQRFSWRLCGAGLASLLTGASLPLEAAPQNPPLQGTTWQLVGIQSMDDAQGLTRPANPSRYTLSLQADGRAVLQLDCNRATGSWRVEPSTDPGNGGFRFGPLARTKALCPAPSLGEPLARQLPFVRGYLLRDGRLNLSLLADGGILIWEPRAAAGPGYSNQPDPALEAAILAASPDLRRPLGSAAGGMGRISYVHARTDLDGDGRQDVLVYLMGPYVCGTGGCTLQVFRQEARGYRLISSFPSSRLPVIVPEARRSRWRDLWRLQSGGGAPATWVREVFDGRGYRTKERIPAAGRQPAGTAVLSGDPSLADGAPLLPRP